MMPAKLLICLGSVRGALSVCGQSRLNWKYVGVPNYMATNSLGSTNVTDAKACLGVIESSGGLPGTNSVVACGDEYRSNLLQVTSGWRCPPAANSRGVSLSALNFQVGRAVPCAPLVTRSCLARTECRVRPYPVVQGKKRQISLRSRQPTNVTAPCSKTKPTR